jgi:hypothetical protein
MSDIETLKELGRVAERLSADKGFKRIWEEYTIQLPLETSKYFEGNSDQIETLIAIKRFREWFENLLNINTKDR